MKMKRHIDEEQPATVDEHFELILNDRTTIDSEYVKVTPEDLPEWFDERLFKIGQKYYSENLLGFGVAHLAGLIAIISVPDILEVLVYTKRNCTVHLSYKRFTETLLLMYALFHADMLDPNSKWFKSLNAVRWRHAMVSKRRVKEGLNGIYQKDMAITQFGFIGYVLICPEIIGLSHGTEEEKIGFNHFWRVTGNLLGMSDRMNICRKDVNETAKLCRRIAYEILAKHMKDPLPDFLKIASNSINGLWYADMSIDKDAFLYLTYQMTGVKYIKPLGWYSYFNMIRRMCLLRLCDVPYIGCIVRVSFNYILAASYWLVEHYPVMAWLAFGKEESKICLYPQV